MAKRGRKNLIPGWQLAVFVAIYECIKKESVTVDRKKRLYRTFNLLLIKYRSGKRTFQLSSRLTL